MNGWLHDGTPVINSVCYGPANDTSKGHYLYYYRDHLQPTDPAGDLAQRIAWSATHGTDSASTLGVTVNSHETATFILAFGGLGLYGGHDDFFLFIQRVASALGAFPDGDKYEIVGAQEMARLARQAGERRSNC